MSRPLRMEYPGAWVHLMSRGDGRRVIYSHDDHRRRFLDLLPEIRKMIAVETHAYCLMDNHYHLLCRTPGARMVSRANKTINKQT